MQASAVDGVACTTRMETSMRESGLMTSAAVRECCD